jgi:hypothetical protein
MRPALQRLLARPSSFELLRFLVNEPSLNIGRSTCRRRSSHKATGRLNHTVSPASEGFGNHGRSKRSTVQSHPHPTVAPLAEFDCSASYPHKSPESERLNLKDGEPSLSGLTQPRSSFWAVHPRLQTSEQLEYESNIEQPTTGEQRLVTHREFGEDPNLWAQLLEFRRRRQGVDGVKEIWSAMRRRQIDLPSRGEVANALWTIFIDAGLQDQSTLLHEIMNYANDLQRRTGESWNGLYSRIIEHLLLAGTPPAEILKTGEFLIKQHPPSLGSFSDLVHNVTVKGSNVAIKTLKRIYVQNEHRSLYSHIVPWLCERDKFSLALDWHMFLVHKNDLPTSQKAVEALIDHLSIYDPPAARKVNDRLALTGVSFTALPRSDHRKNIPLSRESMNELHGETYNIKEKKYNDSLGARWFATKWVSLDVAISTIHALGVREIGPLSLQAIALRESNAEGIMSRIEQLKELGISIGSSVYAKAIRRLAASKQQVHLDELLHSDQHPDALEDTKMQERLLSSYAEAHDWHNYQRTIAILVADTRWAYTIEESNAYVRTLIERNNTAAACQILEHMRMRGIHITGKTTDYLMERILEPRERGKRPHYLIDTHTAISLLTGFLKAGSDVSLRIWHEIFRRLGMHGKLDELESVCLWLAQWFNPQLSSQQTQTPIASLLGPGNVASTPKSVPTSNPRHPLKIIFNDRFQRAVVEWGFLNAWRPRIKRPGSKYAITPADSRNLLHPCTRGIQFLRQLQGLNVDISSSEVRKAVSVRIAALYGVGFSARTQNRKLRELNDLSLPEMVQQVNRAWGEKLFNDVAQVQNVIQKAEIKQSESEKQPLRPFMRKVDGQMVEH